MEITQYNHKALITEISDEELAIIKKELNVPYFKFYQGKYIFDKNKSESLLYKDKNGNYYFPPALIYHLGDVLEKSGYDIFLEDNRMEPSPKLKLKKPKWPKAWKNQEKAIDAIINDEIGFGSIISTMGSGKSRIIEEIVYLRQLPTLIIVPTQAIKDKLYNTFKESYGHVVAKEIKDSGQRVNHISSYESYQNSSPEDEYLEDKGFKKIRGNWQKVSKAHNNIYGKGKKAGINSKMPHILILCDDSLFKLSQEHLDYYEMVIVDEGHISSISSIRTTLLNMENAYYRYFVSATMWRDDSSDFKLLMSAVGTNIIFEESAYDAIQDNRVAKPIYYQERAPLPDEPVGFWGKDKNGKPKVIHSKDFDYIIKKGLVGNKTRNERIVTLACDRYMRGRRILICVTEKAHGQILEQRFKDAGHRTIFIHGDTITKEEKIKKEQDIEKASYGTDPIIVIGTFAIGIGVDTKNIDTVILADVRKSTIRVIQSSGRGGRINELSHEFEIIDLYDWFHPTLEKHSQKRYKMIMDYFRDNDSLVRDIWSKKGF